MAAVRLAAGVEEQRGRCPDQQIQERRFEAGTLALAENARRGIEAVNLQRRFRVRRAIERSVPPGEVRQVHSRSASGCSQRDVVNAVLLTPARSRPLLRPGPFLPHRRRRAYGPPDVPRFIWRAARKRANGTTTHPAPRGTRAIPGTDRPPVDNEGGTQGRSISKSRWPERPSSCRVSTRHAP